MIALAIGFAFDQPTPVSGFRLHRQNGIVSASSLPQPPQAARDPGIERGRPLLPTHDLRRRRLGLPARRDPARGARAGAIRRPGGRCPGVGRAATVVRAGRARIVASKGSRPRLRDMMLQAGVIRRRGHPDQNRLHSTSAHRDPTHRICTYYSSALPDPPGRRPDSSPRAFSRIDETRPNHSSPSRGVISQTSPLRPSEGDDIARPSARPPVRGSIRRCSSRGSGVARQAGPRPCDLALPHRRSDASPTREARPGGPRPIFRRLERRPSP